MENPESRMRIGELARRTGVSAPVLRAWERRYGLVRPQRSEGGFRTYGPDDEARVRGVVERRAAGMPTALAAEAVLAGAGGAGSVREPGIAAIRDALGAALEAFDERAANEALDRLLGGFGLSTALSEGVLPYLLGLGERWERGEVTIAQEHFATAIVRGRLLAIARNWGDGRGPRALLACPSGELHDLGLICFGLGLRERGWRITMLGPNTPVDTVTEAAARLRPDLVVLAAMGPGSLDGPRRELGRLAGAHRLALAGPGAREVLARSVGAELLEGDPVRAAHRVDDATPRRAPAPSLGIGPAR
jgi:MerR family transcriptional regulator, light-induced transcriptional regulator